MATEPTIPGFEWSKSARDTPRGHFISWLPFIARHQFFPNLSLHAVISRATLRLHDMTDHSTFSSVLLLLLLTAIEMSLGGRKTKQENLYINETIQKIIQTIQNTLNTSIHITKSNTHYKTHTYTHPLTTKPTHTHTHILQNPHIHTPTYYKKHTHT
jgi:hypothetical protein